ncbi:glycosyltransferase family 29 protein [Falsiroseomonas sp.]|uniref:glycosyltransferase family 29 protein n=1 Tax=Falsiroseomonas sp. TaxID=2870721 RepID=UPI003F700BB7
MGEASGGQDLLARLRKARPAERGPLLRAVYLAAPPGPARIDLLSTAHQLDPAMAAGVLEDLCRDHPADGLARAALIEIRQRQGDAAAAGRLALEDLARRPHHPEAALAWLMVAATDPAPEAGPVALRLAALRPSVTRDSLALLFAQRLGQALLPVEPEAFVRQVRETAARLIRRQAEAEPAAAAFHAAVGQAAAVAVIGNGPSLAGRGQGAALDALPLVVRCNFPMLAGREADLGRRTDIVFFVQALKSRIAGELAARHASFRSAWLTGYAGADPGPPAPILIEGRPARHCPLPHELARLSVALSYSAATTGLRALIFFAAFAGRPVSAHGFDFFGGAHSIWRARPASPGLHHRPGFERAFCTHVLAPHFGVVMR